MQHSLTFMEDNMTRKDFIDLADVIQLHQKSLARKGLVESPNQYGEYWIDVLAGFCARRNPRFKRDVWVNYIRGKCGPKGGKVKVIK